MLLFTAWSNFLFCIVACVIMYLSYVARVVCSLLASYSWLAFVYRTSLSLSAAELMIGPLRFYYIFSLVVQSPLNSTFTYILQSLPELDGHN